MSNEKRLIDANEAIERAKNSDKIVGSSIWETGEVVEFLEDSPIVDAVEVVRCKDCKYATDMMPIENSGGCLMGECTLRKEDDIVFTAWGDEFCSYGERKDNG